MYFFSLFASLPRSLSILLIISKKQLSVFPFSRWFFRLQFHGFLSYFDYFLVLCWCVFIFLFSFWILKDEAWISNLKPLWVFPTHLQYYQSPSKHCYKHIPHTDYGIFNFISIQNIPLTSPLHPIDYIKVYWYTYKYLEIWGFSWYLCLIGCSLILLWPKKIFCIISVLFS